MLKDNRTLRSYSESFKLKVLSDLEKGELSKNEIVEKYGISFQSLYNWIKKYSRFDLMNKSVRIETMNEKDQIKSLKEEIKQLKEALADKDVNLHISETYLKHFSEKFGYESVDELKKKLKNPSSNDL